ncbi:stage II sporulation protein M [candidate division KSB1 bacterium]|nr:stage II sporulation protein M [candidate division KSB1 bacterium]
MNLFDTYQNLFARMDWLLFAFSVLLFFAGLASAPLVIKKNIALLIKYPEWVYSVLKRYLEREKGFFSLFKLIFTLNALSLFLDFVSGWGVVFPFLLAYLTGLNIAIIAYKMGGSTGIITLILNPVAFFELPAAWFALTFGMQLSRVIWSGDGLAAVATQFKSGLDGFMYLTIPLLLLSGIIEAGMIAAFQNNSDADIE